VDFSSYAAMVCLYKSKLVPLISSKPHKKKGVQNSTKYFMKQEHSKRGAAIPFLVQDISSRSGIITVTREFFVSL